MMDRPILTAQTNARDFRAFYWLKEELVAFCRAHGLRAAGSKQQLNARVEHFLSTGIAQLDEPTQPRRPNQPMPESFARDTVIGIGWRCSERLRTFFVAEIGPHFHFDQAMRDMIKHGAGKTLADAIGAWETARATPARQNAIGAQFEYNRHLRAFAQEHPQATRAEAIADWKLKKTQRRPEPS